MSSAEIILPLLCNLLASYFSYLIMLARTSSIVLNGSEESGHPCLVPNPRQEAFSLSPFEYKAHYGFSYMAFDMLRWFYPIPSLLVVFLGKSVEFC